MDIVPLRMFVGKHPQGGAAILAVASLLPNPACRGSPWGRLSDWPAELTRYDIPRLVTGPTIPDSGTSFRQLGDTSGTAAAPASISMPTPCGALGGSVRATRVSPSIWSQPSKRRRSRGQAKPTPESFRVRAQPLWSGKRLQPSSTAARLPQRCGESQAGAGGNGWLLGAASASSAASLTSGDKKLCKGSSGPLALPCVGTLSSAYSPALQGAAGHMSRARTVLPAVLLACLLGAQVRRLPYPAINTPRLRAFAANQTDGGQGIATDACAPCMRSCPDFDAQQCAPPACRQQQQQALNHSLARSASSVSPPVVMDLGSTASQLAVTVADTPPWRSSMVVLGWGLL